MLGKITLGIRSPIFIILIIAALILSYNLDKPFWGHHDWNGVYWGAVARNFARYGPAFSGFGPFLNSGAVVPGNLGYNFHFTPVFPLVWALFFKIFGYYDWVSRLMAIFFSLGAIFVFYRILEKYINRFVAIAACVFWISTPMFIYFGKMPVHEIPLMLFVLSAFYFHFSTRHVLSAICSIIAMLITWPGYFLAPVLTLFNRKYWILLPIGILLFGLHLSHNFLVTGNFFGGGLREVFFQRVGGVDLIWYLKTITRWAWTYYFLLIPLSLAGFILRPNKVLLYFLLYALFYPIIFRDSASRHDYLLIYFFPFIAAAAASAITLIRINEVKYLTTGLVIILMLYMRRDFIVALQNSSLYKESVRVGWKLASISKPSDKIIVNSLNPEVPFDNWFVSYYADRSVRVAYNQTEFPNISFVYTYR
jgi:4-amino-4-deoxy-L-arabinose transferase-like glycosyltransferase